MVYCPVCNHNTTENICLVCGYDIQSDMTLHLLLNKLNDEEIKDYQKRIQIYKNFYQKKNYTQIFMIYQNEVRKRNTYAMKRLADMYFKGEGTTYNVNLGIELYNKAIELNDSKALYELARKYERGYGHLKQNYYKARELYEQDAKKNNNVYSFIKLGDFYSLGRGGIKDLKKAKRYYEEAIKLGDTYAMRRLGDMYFLGNGVLPNINKGLKLYNQAINLKDKDALLELSVRYKTGYGKLKKDENKAQELIQNDG